jgi:hypothetical protein
MPAIVTAGGIAIARLGTGTEEEIAQSLTFLSPLREAGNRPASAPFFSGLVIPELLDIENHADL